MVVGVDEVGRGSLAGPLVAAAVIIRQSVSGLKDSKALTRLQRDRCSATIIKLADAYGLGWVAPSYIDKNGLAKSIRLAMLRAISQIPLSFDEVIVDGQINYLDKIIGSRAVIKADSFIEPVMAASVIAKVARDNYMIKLASKYAGYSFDRHVGYCTKAHMRAISELGLTKHHRISFVPCRLVGGD